MSHTNTTSIHSYPFLDNGGEMGKLIKTFNWSNTSVGDLQFWPVSLRTIVGMMLHSKYPMFLFWGKDNISFYNDAFVPFFGSVGGHPGALGEKAEVCWAAAWPAVQPLLENIKTGGESSWHGGMTIPIFKNGTLKNVQWTFSQNAVRNDSGEINGVLILCDESVNESLTKMNLEESRNELKFTIDSAEMAIFDYSPITNRFTGNKRLREWFNVSLVDEIDLGEALKAVAEEDRERVSKTIQESLNYDNGGRYEIEYVIRHPYTNEERMVSARGKTFFDENNNAYRLNGVLQDVSHSRLAERKIKESEENLKVLIELLPHFIWITDENGNQIYVSDSWKHYTGLTAFDADTWKQIVHPDDLENINQEWKKSLQSGEGYTYEVRLRNRDNEFFWHKVEGVPLLNEQKQIFRWIGAFTNIHEQIKREAQKDEFIAIASHEMKTPLTTAKGYLELLLMTLNKEDETAHLYASKASQALNRLQNFIHELLDVSKIQNGKIIYNIELFEFVEVLMESVHNVQLTSGSHKIIVDAPPQFMLEADKLRIIQVITNLLSNAIKYSPKSTGVQVQVSVTENEVLVCVTDQGIGIADGHHHKVFQRYYRVEENSVQFQGLGVGLFISYEIVHRHKGEMWVESRMGEGSKFYFKLPLKQ